MFMDMFADAGKDDLIDEFELDEVGLLISEDNIDGIKGKHLTQLHSEICAMYGSNKCLEYLVDTGVDISPLINLYAIENNKKLTINIPHKDELYMILSGKKFEYLECFDPPDIEIAIETIYNLFNKDIFFNKDEACTIVRNLYNEYEWKKMGLTSIIKILEIGKPELLKGVSMNLKIYKEISKKGLKEIGEKIGFSYLRYKFIDFLRKRHKRLRRYI